MQNGYWAFSHNPSDYAKNIKIPVLLMYGAKDKSVSMEETQRIYTNLTGEKKLKVFPDAGHELAFHKAPGEWREEVTSFLTRN